MPLLILRMSVPSRLREPSVQEYSSVIILAATVKRKFSLSGSNSSLKFSFSFRPVFAHDFKDHDSSLQVICSWRLVRLKCLFGRDAEAAAFFVMLQ
ncbi:MAG: hypothetical protein IJ523_06505 [Succinivibrionaceae bacterium]|nr:hypothetical protein [Succinivibrionaceae bacterium]